SLRDRACAAPVPSPQLCPCQASSSVAGREPARNLPGDWRSTESRQGTVHAWVFSSEILGPSGKCSGLAANRQRRGRLSGVGLAAEAWAGQDHRADVVLALLLALPPEAGPAALHVELEGKADDRRDAAQDRQERVVVIAPGDGVDCLVEVQQGQRAIGQEG